MLSPAHTKPTVGRREHLSGYLLKVKKRFIEKFSLYIHLYMAFLFKQTVIFHHNVIKSYKNGKSAWKQIDK